MIALVFKSAFSGIFQLRCLASVLPIPIAKNVARLIAMRQAAIEAFLKTLSAQDRLAEKFDAALWCGLVDFMTACSKDDVRLTFKNGTEIKA